jgi:hypothetical protein
MITIFGDFRRKNCRFSQKPMLCSKILRNSALFWVKNAKQIITLLPGHNAWVWGKTWSLTLIPFCANGSLLLHVVTIWIESRLLSLCPSLPLVGLTFSVLPFLWSASVSLSFPSFGLPPGWPDWANFPWAIVYFGQCFKNYIRIAIFGAIFFSLCQLCINFGKPLVRLHTYIHFGRLITLSASVSLSLPACVHTIPTLLLSSALYRLILSILFFF